MGATPYLSPNARKQALKVVGTAVSGFAGTVGTIAAKHALSFTKHFRYSSPEVKKYGISKRTHYTNSEKKQANTLHVVELSSIARGTALNERERDEITVRGVRIRADIVSVVTDNLHPYVWNYALVQLKQRGVVGAIGTSDIDTDFFRGYESKRSVDFSTVDEGTLKRVLPVNSDKFEVLARGEVLLGPPRADCPGALTSKTVDRYVPLNKKLSYGGTGATTCIYPIVFVYWQTNYLTSNTIPEQEDVRQALCLLTTFRDKV